MNVDDEDVCVNQPMKEMHKGDSQGEIGACENTGEGGKTKSKTQQMEPYQGRNIEAEGALSESDHRLQVCLNNPTMQFSSPTSILDF